MINWLETIQDSQRRVLNCFLYVFSAPLSQRDGSSVITRFCGDCLNAATQARSDAATFGVFEVDSGDCGLLNYIYIIIYYNI